MGRRKIYEEEEKNDSFESQASSQRTKVKLNKLLEGQSDQEEEEDGLRAKSIYEVPYKSSEEYDEDLDDLDIKVSNFYPSSQHNTGEPLRSEAHPIKAKV